MQSCRHRSWGICRDQGVHVDILVQQHETFICQVQWLGKVGDLKLRFDVQALKAGFQNLIN